MLNLPGVADDVLGLRALLGAVRAAAGTGIEDVVVDVVLDSIFIVSITGIVVSLVLGFVVVSIGMHDPFSNFIVSIDTDE